MDEQSDQFFGVLVPFVVGEQHSRKDVRNVSQVELIVEVNGCLFERRMYSLMQKNRRFHDKVGIFLHISLELVQMSRKESRVDLGQRLIVGEWNGDRPEVTLVPGVNEK